MVDIDVRKLGWIPDGFGWRLHGPGSNGQRKGLRLGFDSAQAVIVDYSRLVYAEIHLNKKGANTAGVRLRAAEFFDGHAVRSGRPSAIARSPTATTSNSGAPSAKQLVIKPHCPWQTGKAERLNHTLAMEWVYRQAYTSNDERANAFTP